MNFDDMEAAVRLAKETTNLADRLVGKMLLMCVGRLRAADGHISNSTLTAIKESQP